MALNKEKIGEIATKMLQDVLEESGRVVLNHKEIRRNVTNKSKKLGIKPSEGAEFAKMVIKMAFDKTMLELDAMILAPDKV
jgi:hypothetical protein